MESGAHAGARALLFGGSGQIGAALLPRLLAAGWRVDALSRSPQAAGAGVRWLRGGFDAMPALEACYDVVLGCGPLDHFARWFEDARIDTSRLVAFGSTSLAVKQDSTDAAERALASRLALAEARLFATAAARGTAATLLRPTLVYGAGRDLSLSRIAALARRRGWFPLPRGAHGLRQPVHVDDLAATAMWAIAAGPASHGRGYDLPGGETLAYRDMVARVLAALRPPARLVELPAPVFAALVATARAAGRLQGFSAAAQERLRHDLVFDARPARDDLGHAPRPFRPDAAMFEPR
ncbi:MULTISPECIES: nucleoside-diphosphate sugar epimerase [unclassified Luteimonas]|uniref:nucleoside-diphosphate sugar epimerase n=1 Tax=unclassified Luteimonas TaxID=2629088 RepID=UPI0016020309|nr:MULTISPECIES: nucleoside-diphosphate sugar epimerase [unclassified Luteimonas]MBB1473632.1 nucleoside-diphosphate sugar epimerase [Luteimonas sp. MC1782]MBB6600153.1 nucleoside-diphosphate sugar epimerase [Luteimonas sp. MC1825]QOC87845.1 nucleoside-diphosphate sugar epimerase [Luteimonas sp. MC1825]